MQDVVHPQYEPSLVVSVKTIPSHRIRKAPKLIVKVLHQLGWMEPYE